MIQLCRGRRVLWSLRLYKQFLWHITRRQLNPDQLRTPLSNWPIIWLAWATKDGGYRLLNPIATLILCFSYPQTCCGYVGWRTWQIDEKYAYKTAFFSCSQFEALQLAWHLVAIPWTATLGGMFVNWMFTYQTEYWIDFTLSVLLLQRSFL